MDMKSFETVARLIRGALLCTIAFVVLGLLMTAELLAMAMLDDGFPSREDLNHGERH